MRNLRDEDGLLGLSDLDDHVLLTLNILLYKGVTRKNRNKGEHRSSSGTRLEGDTYNEPLSSLEASHSDCTHDEVTRGWARAYGKRQQGLEQHVGHRFGSLQVPLVRLAVAHQCTSTRGGMDFIR